MRIVKNLIFAATLSLAIGGAAFYANAQIANQLLTNPGAIRDNDINVDLIPEVPGPNQNVKMSVSSYATNLNKATITWTLNGKQSLSGVGKTTFSFTTGEIGSKTEVGIALIVEEGSRVDKIITIQPSQVDILWEAPESYVPPFYKGKALPIQESKVRVVALPIERDGSISPTSKVFNWKKNYVVDQSNSGYGKYFFIVKNSYLDQKDTISVSTSAQSGEGSTGSLVLNYIKPQIMIYEKNPAYGLMLNKQLNTGISLGNGEITISAEPFYFSKYRNAVTDKNMEYKWNINSKIVTPPGKPNEMTLRGSTEAGTANVVISITNINTLFQEARQNLSISIGQ
ncbi:MAG TPA: hypothetical protein PK950_00235 [Candidatus Paceibacterota bacterium]|nr:hypothetical protein [Candidatus Paceibacterota bacterium]